VALKGGKPTSEGQAQPRPEPQLAEPKIFDNPLASSLAQALKQSQRQVDAAK